MTDTEIVAAAVHVACDGMCGARPDQPCTCAPGVHCARVYHARRAGLMDMDDVAYVIRQFPGGVVTPGRAA
jgi:hypothetical protein